MKVSEIISKSFKDPKWFVGKIKMKCIHSFRFLPDEIYLKIWYKSITKKKLNLDNPETFNEKLNWLKIHDHNPVYARMADKLEVRNFINEKIHGAGLNEQKDLLFASVFGVWNSFDEINFNDLPEKFALKTNHDSGYEQCLFCKDKNKFDKAKARKMINKKLKRNYYWKGREYSYKNIKPKIFAEKLLENENGDPFLDFRIFTFGGEPKLICVENDLVECKHELAFYDVNWEFQDFNIKGKKIKKIDKPKKLDVMLNYAKLLAKDTPFLRVDFYYINENVYFSELTFYHQGGIGSQVPDNFGELIKLPDVENS